MNACNQGAGCLIAKSALHAFTHMRAQICVANGLAASDPFTAQKSGLLSTHTERGKENRIHTSRFCTQIEQCCRQFGRVQRAVSIGVIFPEHMVDFGIMPGLGRSHCFFVRCGHDKKKKRCKISLLSLSWISIKLNLLEHLSCTLLRVIPLACLR